MFKLKPIYFAILAVSFAMAACATPTVGSNDYLARPAVKTFISDMVAQYGFSRAHLTRIFAQARYSQAVINAITRPAESLPWHRYQSLFLTKQRIIAGAQFLNQHWSTLQQAQQIYGVPPAVLTAIIGVETNYGDNKGHYRVIDALTTLGFDYPPRQSFFRKELKEYLLLSREQKFDPATVTGSYAGAMGAPQFISSSYRAYAVDFNHDGKSDLWHSWPDIIGSIANYFAKNGWRPRSDIALRATLQTDSTAPAHPSTDTTTAASLRHAGYSFNSDISSDAKVSLVPLDHVDGSTHYWVALHNFRVIMRYNHSPLYAMAVYKLSAAIKKEKKVTSH